MDESAGSPKSNKPNIIFFIADDMYPEMFNCLMEGQDQFLTPNIDRLAREGVVMTNQYVVSPVCTPSRFNCLSGRYASRAINQRFLDDTAAEEGQTVIKWNTFVTEGEKILPHYLKDEGYTTGFVGKNHAVEVAELYQFPDYWADPKDPEIAAKVVENYEKTRQGILNGGFDYAESIYFDNPNFIGLGKLAVQNMDWIAEGGINFIEQNHDRPFFLYFATTIPHQPAQPERSWKADPLITAKGFLKEAPIGLPARESLTPRVRAAGFKDGNKELILWLDDSVGALLDKLEAHGILDNTIIFFFSDHGQKAKGTLYQGGVMSPSIIWKQGGFACGDECDEIVQNIDFAPTILEIAGAENVDSLFDGNSFKGLLDGREGNLRDSFYFELGYARAVVNGDFKYYAIRYPDYMKNMSPEKRTELLSGYNEPRAKKKMGIVNYDPMAPFSHFSNVPGGEQAEHESYGKNPGYFDLDQLYNLAEDPGEQHNLANDSEYKAVLAELKTELEQHLVNLPGKFDL